MLEIHLLHLRTTLLTSPLHHIISLILQNLRERCIAYILVHFDEVSRTQGFEEMGRINVELGESRCELL